MELSLPNSCPLIYWAFPHHLLELASPFQKSFVSSWRQHLRWRLGLFPRLAQVSWASPLYTGGTHVIKLVFLLLTVFYYRELGWVGGGSSAKNLEGRRENYFSSPPLAPGPGLRQSGAPPQHGPRSVLLTLLGSYRQDPVLASVSFSVTLPHPPPSTPGPGAKPFSIHFLGPTSSHPHPLLARLSCPDTQNLSGHSSGSKKKRWRHGRG